MEKKKKNEWNEVPPIEAKHESTIIFNLDCQNLSADVIVIQEDDGITKDVPPTTAN